MRIASGVPHPIPYQGSKRILAAEILSRVPSKINRLVEPFAGSAAISLAAAHFGMASTFWINDAHAPLIALWDAIINRPQVLATKYERLWFEQIGKEREFFNVVRDQFNKHQRPEHFLYLLVRCVKAAIRYNSNGQFNNTPDNRRKGTKPKELGDRIAAASAILSGKTLLTAVDYKDVLSKCNSEDVIYMDPPYQGVCLSRDNRYAPKIVHAEFWDCLAELNRRDCLFIVSYDGRTGTKQHGQRMPLRLNLKHLELCAGRSTQATLLGYDHVTYESLYLSPALVEIAARHKNYRREKRRQLSFA
ncbi:MAG: DNA adenine methylase [Planctomycetaceae bacterium]|nr:DNA adenine methylase [Planctomycetaceae bacterium]